MTFTNVITIPVLLVRSFGKGLLFICLFSFLSCTPLLSIGSSTVDQDNPVDLYGPDGLAFTCDDILVPRGGYTNTAIFATAYGEHDQGTDDSDYDKTFRIAIGSWRPNDSSVFSGSMYLHVLYAPEDPQDPGGPPRWRIAPMATGGSNWDPAKVYEPDYFGKVPDPVATLEDTVNDEDFRTTDWWNNGNNLRISCVSLSNWQRDSVSDTDYTDPAMTLTTKYFPPIKEFVKDIRAKGLHFRVTGISAMNLDSGEAGVAMFGSILIEGLKVEIDGNIDADGHDVKLEGTIENSSLDITGSGTGFEATVELKGDGGLDFDITGVDLIPPAIKIDVDVGIPYILNKIRAGLTPALEELEQPALDRIKAEYDAGRAVDCLANEVVNAVMSAGNWIPWMEAENAAVVINDKAAGNSGGNDAIDLSGTALDASNDNPDFKTSKMYLGDTAANSSHKVTNWGLDCISTDALIYGRDKNHKYSRLVEWYASNWLCLNLTDFQPYSARDQKYSPGSSEWDTAPNVAEWKYFDLICDKELTKGTNDDGDALKIDEGWPPSSHWFGGRGMILGCQGALGHDGVATPGMQGPEKPGPTDNVEPGSPNHVFVGTIALTPYVDNDGAAYNCRGITLGPSDGYEFFFDRDSIAETRVIPWPPPNDAPESELKFFHANVANGHDDDTASGAFQVMWDFDSDGAADLTYGNASYNTSGSELGRLFVYDLGTGRTGVHKVNIYYE